MSAFLSLRLRAPLERFELDVELDSDARRLGLFGPSGAGKTTLLEALAGWRPSRGFVVLGGRTLQDSARGLTLPVEQRGLGVVPQEGLLFPHWNVRRNLLAGVERMAGGGQQRAAQLARVTEVLELGALLERSPATLSGGERARVSLGRALCSGPAALLLDEPLAALDRPLRRRILPYLVRVADEFEVPLVYVSHDPTEVAALCEEVVFLRAGRIEARGPPPELFAEVWRQEALEEAIENVLRGRVAEVADDVARVELAGGGELRIPSLGPGTTGPASALAPGARVVLGLRSDEILIAVEPPRGLSARNVLAAVAERLETGRAGVVLHARLEGGGPALDVLLTRGSTESLGLEVGKRLFLVLKSNSVRVLSALPGR